MRLYPSKKLPSFPFYLILILVVFLLSGFLDLYAGQNKLTEIQRQARLYRQQGLQFQHQGDIDSAFSYYRKAVLLDPDFATVYNDLGIIFETKGYPQEAKEMYLKAIAKDPNYLESYSNLALVYEGEEDFVNAILYWIKRAVLGYVYDPWTETAIGRIESIARSHPEEFSKIAQQYQVNLEELGESYTLVTTQPEEEIEQASLEQSTKIKEESSFVSISPQSEEAISGFTYFPEQRQESMSEPEIPSLANQETFLKNKSIVVEDRALEYLAAAKKSYARGEYVAALKDATVAEYLDSSNKEISDFIEQIRKVLLP